MSFFVTVVVENVNQILQIFVEILRTLFLLFSRATPLTRDFVGISSQGWGIQILL